MQSLWRFWNYVNFHMFIPRIERKFAQRIFPPYFMKINIHQIKINIWQKELFWNLKNYKIWRGKERGVNWNKKEMWCEREEKCDFHFIILKLCHIDYFTYNSTPTKFKWLQNIWHNTLGRFPIAILSFLPSPLSSSSSFPLL